MPESDGDPQFLSFIVRIYRRPGAAREFAGIVELPERNTRAPFRSFAELKRLLAPDAPAACGKGRSRR